MVCLAYWFALSVSVGSAIHQGPLNIDVEGETIEVHVVALSEKGKHFVTDDRTVKLNWAGEIRGFLAKTAMDDMPWDNYYNISLLGKELSFDVDLSLVGCSCNSALFFVSLPGHNPDGSIAHGDGNPYYCDANKMGGVWCWEHDVIESNKHNLAVTPHTCNAPPDQYIDQCDRRGCQVLAYDVNPHGMCPRDDCLIDTRRPFRIHQRYIADDTGKLVRISSEMRQQGNVFSFDSCSDPEYLEKVTMAFQSHMAMTFQLWGEDTETMQFLDQKTGCSGTCDAAETFTTFSNIAIRTLSPRVEEMLVV